MTEPKQNPSVSNEVEAKVLSTPDRKSVKRAVAAIKDKELEKALDIVRTSGESVRIGSQRLSR